MRRVALFCTLLFLCTAIQVSADDRALFNLKGPVKKATFHTQLSFLGFPATDGMVREFTPAGEYIGFIRPEEGTVKVARDKNTVTAITETTEGTCKQVWELISYQPDRIRKYKETAASGTEYVFTLTYDNGHPFTENVQIRSAEGEEYTGDAVYKTTATDKHGNWTERKARIGNSIEMETCVIEYYTPEEIAAYTRKTQEVQETTIQ